MTYQREPSICRDCAIAKGWEWRDGHVATWHKARCPDCGEEKSICPPTDWIRPPGSAIYTKFGDDNTDLPPSGC